eukprot:TRINITY_DN15245_c0_g1_i1.p1 TRINITY_DN15245_c0_g1~~TRINITY_DN15245_c0_g1_i1.p1  ORF type:complete len:394 (+),score=72.08 TRINITY_DN15245_c0_g1_i1:150-1331(+)
MRVGLLLFTFFGIALSSTDCIYLSVNGSDTSGNGTYDRPYRTIQNAVDAHATEITTEIILCLMPGRYSGHLNNDFFFSNTWQWSLIIQGIDQESTKIIGDGSGVGGTRMSLHFQQIGIEDVVINVDALYMTNCTLTTRNTGNGIDLITVGLHNSTNPFKIVLSSTILDNFLWNGRVITCASTLPCQANISRTIFRNITTTSIIQGSSTILNLESTVFHGNTIIPSDSEAMIAIKMGRLTGATFMLNTIESNQNQLIAANGSVTITDSVFGCNYQDGISLDIDGALSRFNATDASQRNTFTCFQCPPGSFQSSIDTTQCMPCPIDTYKGETDGQCTPCNRWESSPAGSIRCRERLWMILAIVCPIVFVAIVATIILGIIRRRRAMDKHRQYTKI